MCADASCRVAYNFGKVLVVSLSAVAADGTPFKLDDMAFEYKSGMCLARSPGAAPSTWRVKGVISHIGDDGGTGSHLVTYAVPPAAGSHSDKVLLLDDHDISWIHSEDMLPPRLVLLTCDDEESVDDTFKVGPLQCHGFDSLLDIPRL